MVTDELLKFVRTERDAGMSESDLKQLLIAEGGWDASDVDEALQLLSSAGAADTAHPTPASPVAPFVQTTNFRATPPTFVDAPSAQKPLLSPSSSSATVSPPANLPVGDDDRRSSSSDDFLGIFSEGVSPAPEDIVQKKSPDEGTGIASPQQTTTVAERSRETNGGTRKEEEALLARLTAHTGNISAPSSSPVAATASPTPWSERKEENPHTKPSAVSSVRFSLTDALRSAVPKGESSATGTVSPHTTQGAATPADSQATPRRQDQDDVKERPSVNIHLSPSPSGREQIVTIEPPVEIPEATVLPKTAEKASPEQESPEKKEIVLHVAAITDVPSSGTVVRAEQRTHTPELPREATHVSTAEHSAVAVPSVFAKRTMASDILLQGTRTPAAPSAVPPAANAAVSSPAGRGFSGISSVLLSGMPDAPSAKQPTISGYEQKDASVTGSELAVPHAQPPVDEKKRRNVTVVLGIALGVLLIVAAAIGAFLFWRGNMGGTDTSALMKTALTHFFGSPTWSYESTFVVDTTLTSSENSGMFERSVLRAEYDGKGSIAKSATGFGDGVHHITFKGEMGADNVLRATDVSLEVRRVGNTLFLRVTKAPPGVELPPNFLDTQWIRVDITELGRELGWNGLEAMGEGYGTLAGGSARLRFENITLTEFPFAATAVAWEGEKGARRATITLVADPDRAIAFMQAMYRKFMNKDVLLSDEDRVRLSDALRKVRGELVVNEANGMPERFMFKADLDDTIFGKHVTGSAAFTFVPGNFGMPLTVAEPKPTLSPQELQREIERHKAVLALKTRDDERVAKLEAIQEALEVYRAARGKYPLTLGELHAAGMLATTTVATTELKEYAYAAYVDAKNTAKTGRCTAKGKSCSFYHIGVDLEYLEHAALHKDADLTSDVRGSDTAGCTLEKERACYDLVAPEMPKTQTSTTTPKTP